MSKKIVIRVVLLPVNVELSEGDTVLPHGRPLYPAPLLLRIREYTAYMKIQIMFAHSKCSLCLIS